MHACMYMYSTFLYRLGQHTYRTSLLIQNTFGLEIGQISSDEWIIMDQYKYQQYHYTFSVLLALALAWIAYFVSGKKQVAFRWLKCRSHYKMVTILHVWNSWKITSFCELIQINKDSDNQGSDNRGCTVYSYYFMYMRVYCTCMHVIRGKFMHTCMCVKKHFHALFDKLCMEQCKSVHACACLWMGIIMWT